METFSPLLAICEGWGVGGGEGGGGVLEIYW